MKRRGFIGALAGLLCAALGLKGKEPEKECVPPDGLREVYRKHGTAWERVRMKELRDGDRVRIVDDPCEWQGVVVGDAWLGDNGVWGIHLSYDSWAETPLAQAAICHIEQHEG